MAETSRRWSPYTYAFVNPLRFIDPDGMENTGTYTPSNFQYSDGYQTHDSYETTGALAFEGAYLNVEGEKKPTVSNINNTNSYDKLKTGTNVTSGKFSGTKLDEVTVTASKNTKKGNTESWRDNDLLRWIPDVISLGVGFNGIAILGAGTSIEANWITRGKDASFLPIITTTEAIGVGYSIDATLNVGASYYLGPSNEISRTIVQTNYGLDGGTAYWGSAGVAFGGKIGATAVYTPAVAPTASGSIGSIVTITGNLGLGLPAGPLPANAAVGVSNTYILKDVKK